MRLKVFAACLALLAIPTTVLGDNTTSAGAYSVIPGGTPSEAYLSDAAAERWYLFTVIAGRSYCAEAQGGVNFDTSSTAGRIDTVLTVYRSDGTTSLGSNDDTAGEPLGYFASRVCWVAPLTGPNFVKVVRNGGGTFYFRTRVVETTLFSNWYFVGDNYHAYTIIRNTTSSTVSYTLNWRNAAGAVVATVTADLGPNANIFYDAANAPAAVISQSGSIDIAHLGSPQAIMASTTVLSAATGLSFDAPFVQRQSW